MDIKTVPVAILAGGLATRMRPITETIPKVLIRVAGKFFLEHQLALLRQQGIRRVVLCLGHLGDSVRELFGDGHNHGIALEYSFDGPKLLGTGGALRAALPMLGEQFFVLYGDSYLDLAYQPVADAFERSGKSGLMTVYKNCGRYGESNVTFVNEEITLHDKSRRLPEMQHIDYGLSLFRSQVFMDWPEQEAFDLSALMQRLILDKQMAGYEVPTRFYEIGSPAGLEELEKHLESPSPPSP